MFDLIILWAPVVWFLYWLVKSIFVYRSNYSNWIWGTYYWIEDLMDEADREPLGWTTTVMIVACTVYFVGSPTVFLVYVIYFLMFLVFMAALCGVIDETTGLANSKPKK